MIRSKLALQLAQNFTTSPAGKQTVCATVQDPDVLYKFQLKLDEELQNIPASDMAEGE